MIPLHAQALKFYFRACKARYRDDRLELRTILAHLRPGGVAVDAGAYKGGYLFWLARAVQPGGQVFAFEPQPQLAAYLQTMCAAMGWPHVQVHACGLSDASGGGTLHVPAGAVSPGASLSAPAGPGGVTHACRLETLDRVLAGVTKVDLLKLDVEGHELQALRGGRELLARDKPAIHLECEARHLRTHQMSDVFAFLEEFGYRGAFFSPRGLLPLSEFRPEVHQRRVGERFWDTPGYCNNFWFHAR